MGKLSWMVQADLNCLTTVRERGKEKGYGYEAETSHWDLVGALISPQ